MKPTTLRALPALRPNCLVRTEDLQPKDFRPPHSTRAPRNTPAWPRFSSRRFVTPDCFDPQELWNFRWLDSGARPSQSPRSCSPEKLLQSGSLEAHSKALVSLSKGVKKDHPHPFHLVTRQLSLRFTWNRSLKKKKQELLPTPHLQLPSSPRVHEVAPLEVEHRGIQNGGAWERKSWSCGRAPCFLE